MTETRKRRMADLVRQARDPDAPLSDQHAAFAALVERFEEAAFATALRACDDMESARDACQEAFLVAWRALPQLREPDAFGGWLKRLVRTQCARTRRRPGDRPLRFDLADGREDPAERLARREVRRLIRRAVLRLPPVEREAAIRFYFLGESLRAIAKALRITVGNAGKQVYGARLRLRRQLPLSITETFLRSKPTLAFTRRVAAGVFDEFVGKYRFPDRPDHPVLIRRERNSLVSYAGGQRNVLVSPRSGALCTAEFDGEGRFHRDRKGQITHFVYYEFGRRLGVARKINA